MSEITFPESKKPEDFNHDLKEQTDGMDEKSRVNFEEKRIIYGDRPQRAKIFDNKILEKLSYVRPWHIFVFWVPIVSYWIYNSVNTFNHSASVIALNIVLGILVWTLAEYMIHKYPFHYHAKSAFGRRNVYIMHGNHHDDPMDPLRGVMPIIPAIVYVFILYQLSNLVVPTQYLQLFFGGFMIGYLLYDGIHYYTHHGKPKNAIGKYLRRSHLIHHVHPDIKFGISTPLWDILLGTNSKKGYDAPKEF